jgi:hypothetical protein
VEILRTVAVAVSREALSVPVDGKGEGKEISLLALLNV